jgi:hypothetical protein
MKKSPKPLSRNDDIFYDSMKTIAVILAFLLATPSVAMTEEDFSEFTTWMKTEDITDQNTYISGRFDCTAFASCLSTNATKAGFPVLIAYINSPQFLEGHCVNVVEVEGKHRFIEPQADKVIEIINSTITIEDPSQGNPIEFQEGKNKIILSGNVLQKVMN